MSDAYVFTAGETMGLFSAERIGSLRAGDSYRFSVGGTESNVAIGLARLGTRSVWLGRVGADEAGKVIVHTLRSEGVRSIPVLDEVAPTGIMFRTRRLPLHSSVSYFRSNSAGSRLRPEDVDSALVEGSAILHLTGVTAALSVSAGLAIDRLVGLAHAAGVPISFDVNFRSRLWAKDAAKGRLTELASHAEILFAGREEAELITGENSLEAQLTTIAGWGIGQAIIKDGPRGATALIDGERFESPAIAIDAVDTVGAGDAFAAGYLHALMTGRTPGERLDLANRVAAFVCSAEGDWEGLPYLSELQLLDADDTVAR